MTYGNEGGRQFKAMPGTAREKARRYGVSDATASRWISGGLVPSPRVRRRIFEDGGPEPGAWDVLIAPPERPIPVPVVEGAASPEATRAVADRLQAVVARILEGLAGADQDPDLLLRDAEKAAGILTQLGKLTGATVLNERQILASPAWRRVEDSVVTALEPWPDAITAVRDALRGLTELPE